MRNIITFSAIILSFTLGLTSIKAQNPGKEKRDFYEIKVYHFKNEDQINKTEKYLKMAYLPALHRMGIAKAGVFKSIDIDTAKDKRIYVFIPASSLQSLSILDEQLFKDDQLKKDGIDYIAAVYNEAPYERIETILLKAFATRPVFAVSTIKAPVSERVYELRSYESATERLYHQKVKMFNEGKEVDIFTKLNFNPIFYAEVIAGCHMPNLMYLTTFNNKADRDEHWDKFRNGDDWQNLSALHEYQNTISKSDIVFLRPTEYSDL